MEYVNQDKWIDRRPIRFGILILAGILLIAWIMNTPEGVIGKADAVGYAVCHRIDGRSFHIGDRQMPLCVRCSGQYLGAVFGLLFLGLNGHRRIGTPPRSVISILALFVIAYAIDGLNSYFHLSPMMELFPGFPRIYEPNNTMRLLTGSGMGFTVSVLLLPTFNRTTWFKYDKRPIVTNLRQLSFGLIPLLLLDLLILSEHPAFLYPLAIISALGVVFLLSMVYSLVLTMIFRMENKFANLAQLIFPFAAGFVVALLQIAIMDGIRYLLTGTWEGFQL